MYQLTQNQLEAIFYDALADLYLELGSYYLYKYYFDIAQNFDPEYYNNI